MWWYRALHRASVRRAGRCSWPRAGRGLRHRRPARAPAGSSGRTCRLIGRGMGRHGGRRAPPPSPARRSPAAASTPCHSPRRASMPRSPPTCCATRAVDPAQALARTAPRAAPRRQAGRQHAGLRLAAVGARPAGAQRPPLHRAPARRHAARRPASSACARATGTACCCRSWSCSASCWRGNAHASDVASFPPWLDAMFHAITEIERRLPLPPARRRLGAGDRGATMNDDTDLRDQLPAAPTQSIGIGLSIVIPVYRGAATIGRLVDALSALHPAGGLEIVLVNDGSPDNSAEVCQDLVRHCRYPADLYRARPQLRRAQRRHDRPAARERRLRHHHG